MNNYYDKYGRLHHKPCIDGEPSSNNGFIYSAYANKLGLLDVEDLSNIDSCRMMCLRKLDKNRFYYTRHPFKDSVPISRDEILGMAALGTLPKRHIYNWNFSPYPIPRFNPLKLAAQLWQLRPSLDRHRNYFWQNNLDQLYRFAFSVPLVDRAFILECWGETNTVRYWFYKGIAKLDSMLGKESGIRWLKYGKSLAAMQKEFPEDHPLRQK